MAERRLILGQRLLQRILEHCLEEKPLEACGILTGSKAEVRRAYATDNAMQSPVFYEVEAEQQERVLRETKDRGEELVAIYHSHPTAPAQPSAQDIRHAVHYPEVVRVIISLGGPTDLRGFLITDGAVRDVPITIRPGEGGEFYDLRHSAGQQE